MERKIFITVLVGSLLFLIIALLLPGQVAEKNPKLPWKIQTDAQGNSTVFGLELGKSSLADAEKNFGDSAKVRLLISRTGEKTLEAYFSRIFLNGLRADFVLTLGMEPEAIEALYRRGLQLSTLDSGVRQVTLPTLDRTNAEQAPVVHITYLPATDLSEELLTKIFGIPSQKLPEPNSKIQHWLYPDKGLDIAVDPDRKEVFQYVRPADFERLIIEPLKLALSDGTAEKQQQQTEE